jgi:glucose-6-phosphate isomerase
MKTFVFAVLWDWTGYTGKPISDVVNVGIGGSDLGPCMVVEALKPYARADLNVHFVSNVDGTHLAQTLGPLDPRTTLFVIVSKTFTTLETLTSVRPAVVLPELPADITFHFVAVSTNDKRSCLGIDVANMFESGTGSRAVFLWSGGFVAGLPSVSKLRSPAEEPAMDGHFRHTPEEHPGILARWGLALNFGAESVR